MTVKYTMNRSGQHVVRVGRARAVVLRTAAEADAFLIGVKVAQLQLAAQIAPFLHVSYQVND